MAYVNTRGSRAGFAVDATPGTRRPSTWLPVTLASLVREHMSTHTQRPRGNDVAGRQPLGETAEDQMETAVHTAP
jgi:hypothetical protein